MLDVILNLVGSDAVTRWLSEVAFSKIMFWTLAFTVAARFHQKEVAKQFTLLREEIRHAAEIFGARMDTFDVRLKRLEDVQDKSPAEVLNSPK